MTQISKQFFLYICNPTNSHSSLESVCSKGIRCWTITLAARHYRFWKDIRKYCREVPLASCRGVSSSIFSTSTSAPFSSINFTIHKSSLLKYVFIVSSKLLFSTSLKYLQRLCSEVRSSNLSRCLSKCSLKSSGVTPYSIKVSKILFHALYLNPWYQ